jgi:hypothetical protein
MDCDTPSCQSWRDLQSCRYVNVTRWVYHSDLPVLTNANLLSVGNFSFWNNTQLTLISLPSLTWVNGYFDIRYHDALTVASFPALSRITDTLYVETNPAFTYLNVPKLTYIGGWMDFCENNAAFRIPSGPPNAPTGGLKVTGSRKGTEFCFLMQGDGVCNINSICP